MRIKRAGTSITVGELRALLDESGARDDAEVVIADMGPCVSAEAGPFSLELEGEEYPIDRDQQAEDHAEFVELIASGKAGTLKQIKARAQELDY